MKKFLSLAVLILTILSPFGVLTLRAQTPASINCPNDVYAKARALVALKSQFSTPENATYFIPRFKKIVERSDTKPGDASYEVELNTTRVPGWLVRSFGRYDPALTTIPPFKGTYPNPPNYTDLPLYFPLSPDEMNKMHAIWMTEGSTMALVRTTTEELSQYEKICNLPVDLNNIPQDVVAATGYGVLDNTGSVPFKIHFDPEDTGIDPNTGKAVSDDSLIITGYVETTNAATITLSLAYGTDQKNLDKIFPGKLFDKPLNKNTSERFTFRAQGVEVGKTYYVKAVSATNPAVGYGIFAIYTKNKVDTLPGVTNGPITTPSTPRVFSSLWCNGVSGTVFDADGKPLATGECHFPDFMDLIRRIINYVFMLVLPIAAIIFAYVGWMFLSSQGNPEVRGQAKSIFVKAIIGLIFVLASWLIVNTIFSTLKVPSCYNWLNQHIDTAQCN